MAEGSGNDQELFKFCVEVQRIIQTLGHLKKTKGMMLAALYCPSEPTHSCREHEKYRPLEINGEKLKEEGITKEPKAGQPN